MVFARECDPDATAWCAMPCVVDAADGALSCPSGMGWWCYPDVGNGDANGSRFGCDCSRGTGCVGAKCDGMGLSGYVSAGFFGPSIFTLFLVIFCLSLELLATLRRRSGFRMNAMATTLLLNAVSCFFGLNVAAALYIWRPSVCHATDEASTLLLDWWLIVSISLHAVCLTCVIIYIPLVWIDVGRTALTLRHRTSRGLGRCGLALKVFLVLYAVGMTVSLWLGEWKVAQQIALVPVAISFFTIPYGGSLLCDLLRGGENEQSGCVRVVRFCCNARDWCWCLYAHDNTHAIRTEGITDAEREERQKTTDAVGRISVRLYQGFIGFVGSIVLWQWTDSIGLDARFRAGDLSPNHALRWVLYLR